MYSYESSRENLIKLIEESKEMNLTDLNEANTRFKFIDRILMECLGWEHNNISCEDSYEGKYSDYTINLFRSLAVLEAKKTGNYFELPIGSKNLIQPIKSIYTDNENLKAAINQVKGYCQDRSIQIAIFSNGWQLVAFIASRSDSVPVLEGNALIIPSLEVFLDNFKEVWNCLSKTGFSEGYLYKKLVGKKEVELPQKLSSTIYNYPGIKNRNPFQVELQIISDLVLEDVIKEKEIEKEFLKKCYCKSGALSSYSLVSKEILRTRYDYLFKPTDRQATLEQVANKKGLSSEFVEIFTNSLSKRPILLVGDVGVGKSTFIDNLILVEAETIFRKSINFKIDLGSKAIISLNIKEAVIDEIRDQLYDIYNIDIEYDGFVRKCYSLDFKRFKQSVKVKTLYSSNPDIALIKEVEFLSAKIDNKPEHLKRSLEYICRSQRKQIIVFIDNCDQRSDKDQEQAFLIAQEFSANWPMIVFLSLRPETFHNAKKESGALSGYNTKAFTIPPPRIDDVITKRLQFAKRITSGQIKLSVLNNITSFSNLDTLIDVLLYSITKNKELLTFINNLSNDNIRKAIGIIKEFFGSGHVNTKKILSIHAEKGNYTIPLHEMLRAVIYGDNVYYIPQNSEIINVFDVRHNSINEHFILLILIALLDDYSKNNRNHGFISIRDISSYFQGLGYNVEQIDSVLNFAYSNKLFETSQRGNILDEHDFNLQIRSTNLGLYHLRFLAKSFVYIDAIVLDTPLFKSEEKKNIHDVMDIDERLSRAEIFRQYLDKQWYHSKISSEYFDWELYSGELKENIIKISEKRYKHLSESTKHGVVSST
jgi:GTPase SAR1 family protein